MNHLSQLERNIRWVITANIPWMNYPSLKKYLTSPTNCGSIFIYDRTRTRDRLGVSPKLLEIEKTKTLQKKAFSGTINWVHEVWLCQTLKQKKRLQPFFVSSHPGLGKLPPNYGTFGLWVLNLSPLTFLVKLDRRWIPATYRPLDACDVLSVNWSAGNNLASASRQAPLPAEYRLAEVHKRYEFFQCTKFTKNFLGNTPE